jgi:hypothetical protein
MKQANRRFEGNWPIIFIFGVCLVWAVDMAALGWNNGLAFHTFRQTQTAITSYYMARGGPFFAYETPVMGYPWSIPFEFPLYQWLVAVVSKTFHIQLESSGRLMSELFFWLSLTAIWGILSELRIKKVYRLIFITLILVSPQYIYWSRTFLMESTALFFSTAHLYFVLRYVRTRKIQEGVYGGVLGAIGALVKVTTFPAFAIVGGLYFVYSLRHDYRKLREYVPALLLFCLPVLVAWRWVQFTDDVKALNVVSDGQLTSKMLQFWTFGSFRQRFLVSTWQSMFSQTVFELSGHPIVLLLPCIGLFFARQRLALFCISLGGFLSAFLIFTNLYVVHDHYAYANGVFLIAAFSWCIVGLLEGTKWNQLLGIAVFIICILNSVDAYYSRLHGYQIYGEKPFPSLTFAIQKLTKPKDVLLIFGADWSPELPYYSRRRALMWPPWMEQDMDSATMKAAIANLKDYKIGAAVFCGEEQSNTHLIQRAISVLGLDSNPYLQEASCTFYPQADAQNR